MKWLNSFFPILLNSSTNTRSHCTSRCRADFTVGVDPLCRVWTPIRAGVASKVHFDYVWLQQNRLCFIADKYDTFSRWPFFADWKLLRVQMDCHVITIALLSCKLVEIRYSKSRGQRAKTKINSRIANRVQEWLRIEGYIAWCLTRSQK